MKKLALLLASLFLLGGCTTEFIRESTYTPTGGADYNPALDPDYNPGGSGDQGGGSGGGEQGGGEVTPDPGDEGDEKLMCTYNIYLSYNHTTKYVPKEEDPSKAKEIDCPILTFEAPMLEPLGKVPDEIAENGALSVAKFKALAVEKGFLANATEVPDPAFPDFKGLSYHGLCLDDSDLWDFTKDYRQVAVVTLYGIWTSNEA